MNPTDLVLPPLESFDRTWPEVAENLACDEALLVAAEDGGGPAFLRFWELDHPAIVLGASCRVGADVHLQAARLDGVPIARRSSGGGSVVIGPGALNVTVVLPIAADPAFAAVDVAQKTVLSRVAEGLRAFGPAVEVRGSGDLTLGSRKFSGSAQRRLRSMMMIHATLLYNFPLDRIDRYLPMPPRRPSYRADRSHADFLTTIPLTREQLISAISAKFSRTQNLFGERDPALPLGRIEDLVAEKFSDPRWIERL